eukprot:scpid61595/ scgid5827/ PiggyBac transposable element-derived protein 4
MDADEALRLIQDADQADLPVEDIACSSGDEVGDSDNDFISSDEEDRLNDDLFSDLEQIGSDSADDIAIPVPVAARGRGAGRGRGQAVGVPARGRGRGRGAATGRGRGAARGRGRGAARGQGRGRGIQYENCSGYDDVDQLQTNTPEFNITGTGLNLPDNFAPTCELDFFKLYFPDEVVDSIVKFTNLYAHEHIAEKKTYQTDGVWKETNRNEFYGLLAFLFFQGFHPLPATRDYWRVTSLYNGNYARCMIRTYRRYLALMCFIKIVDFRAEDINDRLRKVRYLHDHLQAACKRLFIPGKCVSVDERMVKCKGRAPFTQYMPKKPVKWGFKVFAACDAQSSIVVNFEVYTGRASNLEVKMA